MPRYTVQDSEDQQALMELRCQNTTLDYSASALGLGASNTTDAMTESKEPKEQDVSSSSSGLRASSFARLGIRARRWLNMRFGSSAKTA
jgi:hypothetical protein